MHSKTEEGLMYTYFMALTCYLKVMEAMREGDVKKAQHFNRHGLIYSTIMMSTIKTLEHGNY